jgi:hypothetical protein
VLRGKNRFREEKEMQGDLLVKGRRLCLGEDVGGEGYVLMAVKRETRTMEMVELRGKMSGSDMPGGSLALWFWESKSQGPRGARLVLVPFFKWGRRLRVKEKKGL